MTWCKHICFPLTFLSVWHLTVKSQESVQCYSAFNLSWKHPHFSAAKIQGITRLVIYSWMWFSMEIGRSLYTEIHLCGLSFWISENYCIPCAKGIRMNIYLNFFRIFKDIPVFHWVRSSNDKNNWCISVWIRKVCNNRKTTLVSTEHRSSTAL